MNDRSVLITGCSSGIGERVALGLKERGWRVFATARQAVDVARLQAGGLESLPLDLRDSASIRSAVDSVLERTGETGKIIRYVVIEMERDHMYVRAAKFKPMVEAAAQRFEMPRTLIYAIIRVESDFNPYAINSVPAIGLMQVVPQTAGREIHGVLTGRESEPTKAFLFEPENNITYGTAYLRQLDRRHLAGVGDELAREYCVIASYNGGAGALLKTFDADRGRALSAINAMPRLNSGLSMPDCRRLIQPPGGVPSPGVACLFGAIATAP